MDELVQLHRLFLMITAHFIQIPLDESGLYAAGYGHILEASAPGLRPFLLKEVHTTGTRLLLKSGVDLECSDPLSVFLLSMPITLLSSFAHARCPVYSSRVLPNSSRELVARSSTCPNATTQ